MKTKIYLASPWFNETEKAVMSVVIKKLRELDYEVYAPIEHTIPNAWDMTNREWGNRVFQADIEAIQAVDEVWVINFGMYSDSGTAWECGYAYGLGKQITQLLFTEKGNNIFSLMMINGCSGYDTVSSFLYNLELSIDDIEVK